MEEIKPPREISITKPIPNIIPIPLDRILTPGDLKAAVEELIKLDKPNWIATSAYALNLQIAKAKDLTSNDLFVRNIKDEWKRPTFSTFRNLLDNYYVKRGEAEKLNQDEIDKFINAIYLTQPIQYIFKILVAIKDEDLTPGATHSQKVSAFKRKLNSIWFTLRSSEPNGANDTSPFEHIFLGETHAVNSQDSSRPPAALAFHNWLNFSYLQEIKGKPVSKGKIIYLGINTDKLVDYRASQKDRVIQISLGYLPTGATDYSLKIPYSTCFMGTTPEFEIALYTLMYMLLKTPPVPGGNNNNKVFDVSGIDIENSLQINIRLVTNASSEVIVSAYPIIVSRSPSAKL
ncbi:45_t:CDS:2 [Ambispora gerdemannii]|uniref:45_t:CDS:1 n=1 Tax=Ambispora gerdemannii TaxID=144530 RepID=A0A9N9G8S0_9GLOM|nr:45_t:CDS:2 [Ambispora gerdemannii]